MKIPNPSPQPHKGFALVVTISMMVILTAVAVGLLTLSAVSLKSSSLESSQAQARANARLALMMALDKLQSAMGPDQRISARGLTMAKHPALDTSVPSASAKAWWVGVASSDEDETIGPNQLPVVWLVSGLNPSQPPASQIERSSFEREIIMFGAQSIDLGLTGGENITAGAVPIADSLGRTTGAYAYFIDDHGMKAQLAASDTVIVNDDDSPQRPGGSIIPGSYDLSILNGMAGLDGTEVTDYINLNSINDLPLLGISREIARDKRLGYTTRSFGVLSDVKNGRLKRDLTAAFETYKIVPDGNEYPERPSYPVFDRVFAKQDSSNWDKYLLVDESKRSEFGINGYIHWAMLRDYYNIKRYIKQSGNNHYLDPILLSKAGVGGGNSYGKGTLPPHEIGPANADKMPSEHRDLPYGDYFVIPNLQTPFDSDKEYIEYYKHSPITPIIAQMQFNAWMEKTTPRETSASDALRFNTQAWVSHYNPYNISMRAISDNKNASLRVIGMPQVSFSIPKSVGLVQKPGHHNPTNHPDPYTSVRGLGKKEYHVPELVFMSPGHGQVCAFQRDVEKGQEADGAAYGTNVRDLTFERVYEDYDVLNGTAPNSMEWFVDIHGDGLVMHGIDNWAGRNFEVSQILWDPIALESVNGGWHSKTPGKRFEFSNSTFNTNTMASFSMLLRSTNEDGSSIRPLIDSNIRGIYFNPRWDSPLGLDMTASYTSRNNVDHDLGQIPQMRTQPDGKGYSYWGGGHDSFAGYERVILFDIPRQDLVSLGQLQHAGVGRFSYEPSYIVGNSYANPRIPLGEWKKSITDEFSTEARGLDNRKITGSFKLYDASYLVNEELWDSYVFTSIPQMTDDYGNGSPSPAGASTYTSLLKRDTYLPNPRFIPYEPSGSSFDIGTLQKEGSTSEPGAFEYNAGHLMVDGAFNVNSTSVDAWEAFLSGTYGMPFQQVDEHGQVIGFEMPQTKRVRFPRVESVFGGPMTTDSPDENYWTGFRALEQEEVRELARAIVSEVTERGPFLTLGNFVNRKLENSELGEKGALQAALDNTINAQPLAGFDQAATHTDLPDNSNQAAGFPGQLLQGDILQALSPCMTVRSDSFTIRAYGESVSPATGEILAKAWCEATVQRYPDPISPDPNKSYLEELVEPSNPHGRQFRLTGFRWLSANEI